MNNDKKGGVRLLTGAWKHFRTITYHKYLVMRETEGQTTRSGRRRDIPPPGSIIRDETGIIMNTGSITAQEMCREDWLRWRCR